MTSNNSIKRFLQKIYWQYFWDNFQLPVVSINEIVENYQEHEPAILDEICLPPYRGNHKFNDYSILISLIHSKQPANILELGTAHGNTVANMCAECDAQVYTVNALPEQIEGSIITYTLCKDQIGIVYRKLGYENRVVQIYENTKSLNILDYVLPKSIDFVFIDACHDAEFVVNDFIKILPALSDRAIVLFHDTHPLADRRYLDSYLGCMFLRKIGYDVKQIASGSLAFWSMENPNVKTTHVLNITNQCHSILGKFIYGDQESIVRGVRWLASGFLRGKFSSP